MHREHNEYDTNNIKKCVEFKMNNEKKNWKNDDKKIKKR